MKPVSLLSPSSKLTCGHRIEQVAAWRACYPAALHPESPVRELGPERRLEPKRALGEYSDYAKLAKLVNTLGHRGWNGKIKGPTALEDGSWTA